MADVFISYNKADRDLVRLTAAFLEANGYSVWWDAELVAGDDFQLKILDEVAKARAVIVIWTPASVKSTWVRSEAGRAQSDHKLIPLKAAGVTYDEIPPPFNLLHTEDASNRDAVLLSAKSQMGKLAPVPVLIKQARYEVLSWIGVIGTAVTLFSNLKGAIALAKWSNLLVEDWAQIVAAFWSRVLFFPYLDRGDAITSSFIFFGFISLISTRQSRATSPGYVSLLETSSASFFMVIALAAGLFFSTITSIASYSAIAVATLQLAIINIAPPSAQDSAFLFYAYSMLILTIAIVPWWLLIWLWGKAIGARARLIWFACPLLLALFMVIIDFTLALTLKPGTWAAYFSGFTNLALPLSTALVPLGGLLALIVAFILRKTLNVKTATHRLWRILAGIALLTTINYGFLWLEKQPWGAELLK